MPDRGFQSDMNQIQIPCTMCDWSGKFKDYDVNHLIKTNHIKINSIYSSRHI